MKSLGRSELMISLMILLGHKFAYFLAAQLYFCIMNIAEYHEAELPAANLLASMETVRDNYWKRMGE